MNAAEAVPRRAQGDDGGTQRVAEVDIKIHVRYNVRKLDQPRTRALCNAGVENRARY